MIHPKNENRNAEIKMISVINLGSEDVNAGVHVTFALSSSQTLAAS